MNCIRPMPILIPKKNVDLKRWAVVACDQFTSEPSYWATVARLTDGAYSAAHLIFPERYLSENVEERISSINAAMDKYLAKKIFREIPEGMIAIKRDTPFNIGRRGLVTSVDLECYSYRPEDKAEIRATEKTILDRIPPRVKIREKASLELPHIMVLIDDPHDTVITTAFANTGKLLYDTELNMNGGNVLGYSVNNPDAVLRALDKMAERAEAKGGFAFAVGDGNHSLATAKTIWEKLKPALSDKERENHPARFALAEIVNIYDPAIRFEPIHRVVFGAGADFLDGLKGGTGGIALTADGETVIALPKDAAEAVDYADNYIRKYSEGKAGVSVDYIHGADSLREIVRASGAVGISMPNMDKPSFFSLVASR
ncbi:MAG: DUF1015 domain-containing protein, partial [Clostridiales bacterium]|nr:DUF1015 domain-containing protein [Clostridiales bacterium]